MVSFSCEVCNDTIVKKKLMQHKGSCSGAYFTCLDCQTTFQGLDFQKHTSCISEAEKYQKSLYKAPAKKQRGSNVTEKKKVEKEEEKDTKEAQVSAVNTDSKVEISQKEENATDGDKKETSPKKPKKDKKDKKKEEATSTTARKEDRADASLNINDKEDEETAASSSESKAPETKANKESKSDKNKRKRDETTEAKTGSSEVNGNAGSTDEVATAGKKTKVEKPATGTSSTNGKTKSKMPSDAVQSHIQSMIGKGGAVSFKTLIKRLKRNKMTHNITKAELLGRLSLKAEGDKLILSISS
ncbi:hypothetical protein V1509DRAFT_627257 [Lipomyces kononenkoae]